MSLLTLESRLPAPFGQISDMPLSTSPFEVARRRVDDEGKKDTRKYSLDELRKMRERGETETRADAPALSLDAEFWDNARVVMPRAANPRSICGSIATCWNGSRRRGAAI
jgi:hypothetical protein